MRVKQDNGYEVLHPGAGAQQVFKSSGDSFVRARAEPVRYRSMNSDSV